MKIIERVEWSFEFTCTGCKSKLAAEADDVKYGVSGMDAEGGYYCTCVVCGEQRDLSRAKVPSSILDKALDAFHKRNR